MNKDKNLNKKINNSKLNFKNVVLQHKKEYLEKRKRTILQKLIGTNKTQSYLDFLLKRRRSYKNYPRFFSNPLDYKKHLNKYFKNRSTNTYSRYEALNENYKHTTLLKILFARYHFHDFFVIESRNLSFRIRATKQRRQKKKVKRSQFGVKLGFKGFKTLFLKCFFPSKLIGLLDYRERISLGSGPFTETGKYFLDDSERLLIFHRYYLQQYKEFLYKNKKTEEAFRSLENYLESKKYTHDVLTTMPGARWNQFSFMDSIDNGIFDLNNNEHVLKPTFNFEDQEILTELEETTEEIIWDFTATCDDVMFHLETDNWTYYYNISLTDLDDRPPVWRYFTKVWFGLDREVTSELNDDFFYFYKIFFYSTLVLCFPGFYTSKKPPYRIAGYKPWTRKARYRRYIRTMFTRFQSKRYHQDVRIKKSRLQISFLTKFLVFSFVFFIIFL